MPLSLGNNWNIRSFSHTALVCGQCTWQDKTNTSKTLPGERIANNVASNITKNFPHQVSTIECILVYVSLPCVHNTYEVNVCTLYTIHTKSMYVLCTQYIRSQCMYSVHNTYEVNVCTLYTIHTKSMYVLGQCMYSVHNTYEVNVCTLLIPVCMCMCVLHTHAHEQPVLLNHGERNKERIKCTTMYVLCMYSVHNVTLYTIHTKSMYVLSTQYIRSQCMYSVHNTYEVNVYTLLIPVWMCMCVLHTRAHEQPVLLPRV